MSVFFPGWSSVESVTKLHRWFEILTFVALGLLLLFEILAYVYGQRRDHLLVLADATSSQERQTHEDAANRERDAQIGRARQEAADARDAQRRAEELAAPRHLTESQRTLILASLNRQTGGILNIKASMAAGDARSYSDEMAGLFRSAGWTVTVENALFAGTEATGIWILIQNPSMAPIRAVTLQRALEAAGISVRVEYDPTLPAVTDVWLCVGPKVGRAN